MSCTPSADGGARLVLVHGFTQTGRCWGPSPTTSPRDHEVRRGRRARPRRLGRRRGRPRDRRRAASPTPAGPATYVGYSMGGRLVPARRARPPRRWSQRPGAGRRHRRHRGRRRAGRPTSAPTTRLAGHASRRTASRRSSTSGWPSRCSPALPPDARLPGRAADATPPPGWPSSLRAGRHRHPGAAVGPPADARRCRCCVRGRASDDAKFTAARGAAWPTRSAPNATVALVPGAGHAAHLEQPDAFLADRPPLARRARPQRRGTVRAGAVPTEPEDRPARPRRQRRRRAAPGRWRRAPG